MEAGLGSGRRPRNRTARVLARHLPPAAAGPRGHAPLGLMWMEGGEWQGSQRYRRGNPANESTGMRCRRRVWVAAANSYPAGICITVERGCAFRQLIGFQFPAMESSWETFACADQQARSKPQQMGEE